MQTHIQTKINKGNSKYAVDNANNNLQNTNNSGETY